MRLLLVVLLGGILLCHGAGCRREVAGNHATLPEADEVIARNQQSLVPEPGNAVTGKVLETINAGKYTYARIDTGTEELWAAAPACEVAEGDQIGITRAMPMANFQSPTMNRTFELIYFVPHFLDESGKPLSGQQAAEAAPHGSTNTMAATHSAPPADVQVDPISPPAGGLSIEQLYAEKEKWAGKEVLIRGKVVRYRPQILGTNWLHVQDGSGSAQQQNHDITVTSSESVQEGDVVLVKGILALDKDLGFGYSYAAIIEKAELKAE